MVKPVNRHNIKFLNQHDNSDKNGTIFCIKRHSFKHDDPEQED